MLTPRCDIPPRSHVAAADPRPRRGRRRPAPRRRTRSRPEIAAELAISIATVKAYLTRLLTKLDARDRVQLVIIAYDAGLVAPTR
jgi:regulatory LuxR family protein